MKSHKTKYMVVDGTSIMNFPSLHCVCDCMGSEGAVEAMKKDSGWSANLLGSADLKNYVVRKSAMLTSYEDIPVTNRSSGKTRIMDVVPRNDILSRGQYWDRYYDWEEIPLSYKDAALKVMNWSAGD